MARGGRQLEAKRTRPGRPRAEQRSSGPRHVELPADVKPAHPPSGARSAGGPSQVVARIWNRRRILRIWRAGHAHRIIGGMADTDALSMLRAGYREWHEWRRARASIDRIDLRGADLRGRNLKGFDLTFVLLEGADLSECDLFGAELSYSSLQGSSLRSASLWNGRLMFADCSRADFGGGSLARAYCYQTNFSGTSLCGAELSGTVFTQCQMDNADFALAACNDTVWAGLDLSRAKNLHTTNHDGPSTVGMDTVFRSRGDLPDRFLRGVGFPHAAIAYLRSLGQSASPIEMYSCFISYSSKDQEFCQRLHNDLQAAHGHRSDRGDYWCGVQPHRGRGLRHNRLLRRRRRTWCAGRGAAGQDRHGVGTGTALAGSRSDDSDGDEIRTTTMEEGIGLPSAASRGERLLPVQVDLRGCSSSSQSRRAGSRDTRRMQRLKSDD
jgi:Pentapeptide repeats (8 copies)